jgi:hypothetical protein
VLLGTIWSGLDGDRTGERVNGRGTSGRDQAIAKAVADATDQATAAANAAGVTLGPILDMQVFASMADPCPLVGEVGGTAIAGPAANGGGSSAPYAIVGSCEPSVLCPGQPCTGSYATVTMTWSIAGYISPRAEARSEDWHRSHGCRQRRWELQLGRDGPRELLTGQRVVVGVVRDLHLTAPA